MESVTEREASYLFLKLVLCMGNMAIAVEVLHYPLHRNSIGLFETEGADERL